MAMVLLAEGRNVLIETNIERRSMLGDVEQTLVQQH